MTSHTVADTSLDITQEKHTEVVHVDFGGKKPTPHTKRGIIKEMKGRRVREKISPSSTFDGDDEEQSSHE